MALVKPLAEGAVVGRQRVGEAKTAKPNQLARLFDVALEIPALGAGPALGRNVFADTDRLNGANVDQGAADLAALTFGALLGAFHRRECGAKATPGKHADTLCRRSTG